MDEANVVDDNHDYSNPMTGEEEGLLLEDEEEDEEQQQQQPQQQKQKHASLGTATITDNSNNNYERAIYIVFNLDTSGFSMDNNKITKIESKSLDYKGKLLNGFNFTSIVDEKQYQPFSVVGKDFMNNVLDSIAFVEEEYYNSSTNVEHIIFVSHCSRNYDVCFLFHQLNKNGLYWPQETVDKLYKLDTKQLAIQAIKEQQSDLEPPSNYQLQGLYNYCTNGKKELVYGKDRVDAIVKILVYSKFWPYRIPLISTMEAKPIIIPTVHKLVRAPGSVRHTCVYCALVNNKIGQKKTRTRFQCCVPTCNLPLCNNSVPTGNYISDMYDPTSDDAIDCFKLAHANKDIHQQCLNKFIAMQKATNKRYRNSLVRLEDNNNNNNTPTKPKSKKKTKNNTATNDTTITPTGNDDNNTTPTPNDNDNTGTTPTASITTTAKRRGRPKKNTTPTTTTTSPKQKRPRKKQIESDDNDDDNDITDNAIDELQYV